VFLMSCPLHGEWQQKHEAKHSDEIFLAFLFAAFRFVFSSAFPVYLIQPMTKMVVKIVVDGKKRAG
jgi:hypothetical protein